MLWPAWPCQAATPNPKTAGPRPSFPSKAHACTITRLTTIIYAMIFRTSVKTFTSISYTDFPVAELPIFFIVHGGFPLSATV